MTPSLLLRSAALVVSLMLAACAADSVAAGDKAGGPANAGSKAQSREGAGAASTHTGIVKLGTRLSGEAEVPPNSSMGDGDAVITLNRQTRLLRWTVTYSGLTGDVSAAHFHGPAMAGDNAGPVITLGDRLKSPIEGEATLTDAQIDDLLGGRWYLNLHTPAHAGGEIRGQIGTGM